MKRYTENMLALAMFKLARIDWLCDMLPDWVDNTTDCCKAFSIRCYRRNLSLHYTV